MMFEYAGGAFTPLSPYPVHFAAPPRAPAHAAFRDFLDPPADGPPPVGLKAERMRKEGTLKTKVVIGSGLGTKKAEARAEMRLLASAVLMSATDISDSGRQRPERAPEPTPEPAPKPEPKPEADTEPEARPEAEPDAAPEAAASALSLLAEVIG